MRDRSLVSSLACALVLAGCNDHRYGFFGDTDGEGGSTDADTSTTGITTLSPTTVSPTTVQPTTITDPTTTTFDPTTTTDPTTPTTTPVTTFETTDTTTGGLPCGSLSLPAIVPVEAFGTLSGQGDEFSLSCGGFGGSDLAWVWTAPNTGRFRVETVGSNFDSVLAVIDGVCFGPELGCDDDGAGDQTSRVEVDLFAGQVVTFAVDSFLAGFGEVHLTVTEVPIESMCPDGDFGSQVPFQIPGQTAGAPNVRGSACGGESSPEIEGLWTAPFDGTFRFMISDADFEPILYLLADSCDGSEFACTFAAGSPLDVFLPGGQQVIVVVDGNAGTAGKFTLTIDQVG